MPKKATKKSSPENESSSPAGLPPDESATSTESAGTAAAPKPKPAKRKVATGTAKSPVAATKKKSAKSAQTDAQINDEDIRVRAYLIGEQRRAQSLPGDESTDWFEAARQLREESGAPA